MSKPPVIICGASARALAQSAYREGHQVYAVDHFADYDTTQVAEIVTLEELPRLLDDLPLETASLSCYVGGMENQPDSVAQLSNKTLLLGNPATTLNLLSRKLDLLTWLASLGYDVPHSFSQKDYKKEIQLISNSGHKNRYLRKRWASCGGLDIHFADDMEEVNTSTSNSSEFGEPDPYYLQEFISGNALSAAYYSTTISGKIRTKLLGISHQLCGCKLANAPNFVYSGSIVDPNPEVEAIRFATRIGQSIASRYGLTGLFNIDFIRAPNRYFFLEVNPRYSASMELWERICSVNLFAIQKQCFESSDYHATNQIRPLHDFNRLMQPPPSQKWTGKLIWYADRELEVPDSFPTWAIGQKDSEERQLISDIPMAGTRFDAGQPLFTVFSQGDSLGNAFEALVETAKMFDSQLVPIAPNR